MKKQIKIAMHAEGYNDEQLSCLDISMAAIAGFFHEDYYDYYCFLHSLNVNYRAEGEDEEYDLYQSTIKCMENLNIKYVELSAPTFEDLMQRMKECLDNNKIFFIDIPSKLVFYINEFKREDALHAIIICGYDDEKRTVCLQDYRIIDKKLNSELFEKHSSNPLYRMNISYDLLRSIWENSELTKKIGYTVEEEGKTFKGFGDMIEKAYHIIMCGEDRLIRLLMSEKPIDIGYFPIERRHFIYSYFIIFDFLKRYFYFNPAYNEKVMDEERRRLGELEDLIITTRSKALGYLQKEHVKKAFNPKSEQAISVIGKIKEQNKKIGEILEIVMSVDGKEHCGG